MGHFFGPPGRGQGDKFIESCSAGHLYRCRTKLRLLRRSSGTARGRTPRGQHVLERPRRVLSDGRLEKSGGEVRPRASAPAVAERESRFKREADGSPCLVSPPNQS